MAYPGEQIGNVDVCGDEVYRCINALNHKLLRRTWQCKVSDKSYQLSHDFGPTVKIAFSRNHHDIQIHEFSFDTIDYLEDWLQYVWKQLHSQYAPVSKHFSPLRFQGAEMMSDDSDDGNQDGDENNDVNNNSNGDSNDDHGNEDDSDNGNGDDNDDDDDNSDDEYDIPDEGNVNEDDDHEHNNQSHDANNNGDGNGDNQNDEDGEDHNVENYDSDYNHDDNNHYSHCNGYDENCDSMITIIRILVAKILTFLPIIILIVLIIIVQN